MSTDSLLKGKSPPIDDVRGLIGQVASKSATVMITGPSGTGKELVARTIHNMSRRKNREFVAVNCGAIPENLLESELFGHEKGSFTGALTRRIGRFEQANGGTIFLDEIGDMPFDMQVKLLRVLEERTIERVGSSAEIELDVRVICATHQNLQKSIADGKFREDLFFRLNVFPINVPPLLERREDVPILIDEFFKRFMDEHDARGTKFAPDAMGEMMAHDWPGNIRELRNVVERACIMFAGKTITMSDVNNRLLKGRQDKTFKEERDAVWDVAGELDNLNADIATTKHLDNFDAGAWVPETSPATDDMADAIADNGSDKTMPSPEPTPASDAIDLGDVDWTGDGTDMDTATPPQPTPTESLDDWNCQAFFDNTDNQKLKDFLAEIEKSIIVEGLKRSDNSVSGAAKLLGLQRTTLIEKIKKYGIET